jgi:uncharacterized membrane protein
VDLAVVVGVVVAVGLAAVVHQESGSPLSIMVSFSRLLRHFFMTRWHVRRAFPEQTLRAIENAIAVAEKSHGGEIRFAVEGELHTSDLLCALSPRRRAEQIFAQLGVWNTEHNNGVLIYVLLADRIVEIIADRGYGGRVTEAEWASACEQIEKSFLLGQFERGAIEGITSVSRLIAHHFPISDGDELPNRPAML